MRSLYGNAEQLKRTHQPIPLVSRLSSPARGHSTRPSAGPRAVISGSLLLAFLLGSSVALALPPQSTSLQAVTVTATTGEKPQSKVWAHAGEWWSVLPASTGTWLRRLDGDTWTDILQLSSATGSQADVKTTGDVAHVLLFEGSTSELVSVEYVSGSNTYQAWSGRPTASPVTLDSGVETATIDIDSEGRMWLASDASTTIHVRYSDPPYSAWSAPIVLATGVSTDDISVVAALPDGTVGVLWSNQSTDRFGFRTHADGTAPSVWSADEVPASQSALPVGGGMADDHLNVAVGSDGTLYAAVKTSYDTAGYPKIALLVRRPGGTWDDLHEVDQSGTRGIVLLDEDAGVVTVVYTSSEGLNDIVYKESPTSSIAFGARSTLIGGGLNDVTSTKENITDDVVILASSSSAATGVLLSTPSTPGAPEVTVTAPNGGEFWPTGSTQAIGWVATDNVGVTAIDIDYSTNGGTSWIPIVSGLANTGSHAWTVPSTPTSLARVRVTAHDGDGHSTSDASDSNFTIADGDVLVGSWPMEEGSGTTIFDASGYGNDGALTGNPGWVTGVRGLALDLDGSTQYGLVPDDASLDLTGAITLVAWIKPDVAATQYLIKKAIISNTDGYELSLASPTSGAGPQKVFVRFNQVTSGNDYRLNSISTYPADGNTWMHVAATYDGATIRIYVNGFEEDSLPASIAIATNSLGLGIGADSSGNTKFNGAMDEARVYGRALSPTEIRNLADATPPSVTVTAPNGGEVWPAGSVQVVGWTATDNVDVTSVDLEYSTDSGSTWNPIASGLANTGTYSWTIPATPTVTARVRVTARDGAANSATDTSDGDFEIQIPGSSPVVTVIAPNGGEQWTEGTTQDIDWFATDNVGVTAIDIEYSTDGGSTWTPIASGLSNTPPYAWTVANTPTTSARVRVTAHDGDLNTASDESDADFEIREGTPPVVEVAAPNGGESWAVGSIEDIDWTASDNVGVTAIDLDFSTDGGSSWTAIAAGLANTPPYAWTIPNTPTTSARVRVTAHDGAANSATDASDADFTIFVSNAPVGYWPMEEGGGTVILDASGHGNDGNLSGAPSWVTGVRDLALDLNGTTDYALVPDDPTLDLSNAITLATWIRPEKVGTQYLVKKAVIGVTDGYELSLSSSGKPFVRYNQFTSGNTYRIDGLTSYPSNGIDWMHLAATYDGVTMRLYLNGIEEASSPATFTIATNDLPLGIGAQSNGVTLFQGAMDEVLVYGRALDPAEITNLADATPPSVTVTAPNGGESWAVGSSQNVTWTATDNVGVTAIDLDYSTDGGATWISIAAGLANSGTHAWTIPDTPTATARVRATARDGAANSASDESDADFAIVAAGQPVVTVIAPNGGEQWIVGTSQDIDWLATDNVGVTAIDIDYSTDSGATWIAIAAGLANTPPHAWTIPATPTAAARVRVTAHDDDLNTASDESAADFIILDPDAPRAYWPMEEGSGTSLIDASGYGHDATLAGSPAWAPGVAGLSLVLDGATQYGSVTDAPLVDITGDITLAAWVKPTVYATQYLIKKANIDETDGYELSLATIDSPYGAKQAFVRFNQATSSNTYRVNSVSFYPVDGDTWVHLAATYDGATIRIYVNGVEENSAPAAITIAANDLPLAIGAQSNGNRKFNGAIDEARVYGRALSPTEIEALADIMPPTVALTAPNGGESWLAGATEDITWTATDIVGVTAIDLDYSTDGGSSWIAIASALTNTGTYSWTVPNTPSVTARVRVTARDAAAQSASDPSDADFEIRALPLTDLVGPEPDPDACISTVAPCLTVPVNFTRSDATPVRGYTVTLTLDSSLSLCDGIASITEGDYLSLVGGTSFQVTDQGGGSYTVDCVILGEPCGATGNGNLFDLEVEGTIPDGNGTITITSVTVRDCDNGPVPANPGPAASIRIDSTPPAAIDDLAAVQVKTANPPSLQNTTGITLTFTIPGDAEEIEVWRAPFGNYPEYDDGANPGSEPAAPSAYPPGPPWELVPAVTASGETDEPPDRDFWYYVAYARDGCGNTVASNRTDGTLNYHLGDVSDGSTPGNGDNLVDILDISAFEPFYGDLLPGDPDARNFLDIGPTADYSVDALPSTDNRLDFEDLILMAINFGEVSLTGPAPGTADEAGSPPRLQLAGEPTPDGVLVKLLLAGNSGSVKGLHGLIEFDPTRMSMVSVEQGELLAAQNAPVFFRHLDEGGAAGIHIAILGREITMRGSGEVARLHFRGRDRVELVLADLRDIRNRFLGDQRTAVLEPPASPLPTALRLHPARPNPFNPSTIIPFDLPSTCEVSLRIYDVAGRQVRILIEGVLPPGEHAAQWDGRSDRGHAAGTGVYVVRLRALDREMKQKIHLVK